jgi:non-heme chloroperoxidase
LTIFDLGAFQTNELPGLMLPTQGAVWICHKKFRGTPLQSQPRTKKASASLLPRNWLYPTITGTSEAYFMTRKLIGVVFSAVVLLSIASGAEKEWKDLFVQIGDIKIHYLDAGSGDRTLIFMPGWTMPAEVWKNQITYFSGRGFRAIALDPRSQGLSAKTEAGNTYQQHAADLHEFLKVLKIDHSYLIGWDAGVTALLEYISSPETFKPEKMVFVGGSPTALKIDDYPGSITPQAFRSLFLALQEDRKKTTDKFVQGLFNESHPGYLYTELAQGSLRTPMSAALSLLLDQYTGDRRSALLHVAVPTLIIANSENRLLGECLKSKTPRSTLEIIEGSGDAIFLDKPQAFNQALESFFGEH